MSLLGSDLSRLVICRLWTYLCDVYIDALVQRRFKSNGIKSAGTMKKRASKGSEHMELPTNKRLCDIWEVILSDSDARKALERLDQAGFRISHLKPNDATFKHPTWADYIAAIPLLPNEPSTRRIHSKTSLRKYWPLIQELRQFAARVNFPFVDVTIYGETDYPVFAVDTLREDLLKAATMLEYFLSWNYCVLHLNPRNAVIAELRWTIRERTGRPHDRELNVLIDAAFRAAGYKEGCYIDSTALDRIEKRQGESRVKANRRIQDLIGASSPSLRRSTRVRRSGRKRV